MPEHFLACLLHDVGHSQFSHIGESFYKSSTDFINLIFNLTSSTTLKKDMDDRGKGYGKPHEAMSVIIGLKLLDSMTKPIEDYDRELFARSMMGVYYEDDDVNYNNVDYVFLNAIIGMLNGNLVI